MSFVRRRSRPVQCGRVRIGGEAQVSIQSMAKSKTSDVGVSVRQILQLEKAGCEIVRVAVKDFQDAAAIKKIKAQITIPLVADIHFDRRLALAAIEAGCDKIRLNPGNISRLKHVREVAAACRAHRIPIRVGVNSGSVPRGVRGRDLSQRMCSAALSYARFLERCGVRDIVISLKASTIRDTVAAYRAISTRCDYPLHLGLTATGAPSAGGIKSAIAIGVLLLDGIGDTIRISLTDTPQQEVRTAQCILEAVGLRSFGPEIISCPTCGRCEVDLVKIVGKLEQALSAVPSTNASAGKPATHALAGKRSSLLNGRQVCLTGRQAQSTKALKVAVMGCVVNGPGEAREADIGVAFGAGRGMLFKKGKPVRTIDEESCVKILMKELRSLA